MRPQRKANPTISKEKKESATEVIVPDGMVHLIRNGKFNVFKSPVEALNLIELFPQNYALAEGVDLEEVKEYANESGSAVPPVDPGNDKVLTRAYLETMEEVSDLADVYIELVKDAPDPGWDKNKLVDEILSAQDALRAKAEDEQ